MTPQERANLEIAAEYDRREREATNASSSPAPINVAERKRELERSSADFSASQEAAAAAQKPQAAAPVQAARGPSALEQFAELVGAEFGRLEKKHDAEIAELRVQHKAELADMREQIKDEVLIETRTFISKALSLRDEIRASYGNLQARVDQSLKKLDSIEAQVARADGHIN